MTIAAADWAYYAEGLWRPFEADKCPGLAGKPKFFFFGTCRGLNRVKCTQQSVVEKLNPVPQIFPTTVDFLWAYCSMPSNNLSYQLLYHITLVKSQKYFMV